MKPTVTEQPALPPHRAFVIQFRAETDAPAGRLAGRVEHVASGRAAHFRSLDELLAFLDQVLGDSRERSSEAG